jgi:uncharacterized cupredoxin-like copper-binding protein
MSGRGEPKPAPLAPAASRLRRRALLAGLLAAVMPLPRGFAGAAETEIETIELVAVEYRFIPDHLELRHGAAYRLQIDNRGAELHEFTAAEFLAASTIENPEILATGSKEIVIRPGERRILRFIAPRPGRYPFACADHDWAGMVGHIVVS